MTDTQTTNIAQRLKIETRASHDAIEANAMMKGLMQKDLTPTHYQQVLQKKYGYHKAIEPILGHFLKNTDFDYPSRQRAHLIREDLMGLGLSDAQIDALPTCNALPDIKNIAQALGMLYVLEGSTLGGQVIARHLSQTLSAPFNEHIRFFSAHGKEKLGVMWQEFQKFLVNYAQEHLTEEQNILDTAIQTFDTLNAWMKN